MKTIYDVMTEAIDGIDEKYLIKTAECFHLPKEALKRNVTINSEELIEMKKEIKKTNHLAKITAVAAAFICVVTVATLLVVNNNKVHVLGGSSENSVISDPFTESTEKEPQISPEKQNVMDKINSLISMSELPKVKFENENKDDPKYIDYNGGKIKISLSFTQKASTNEIADSVSDGWYVTINGILQNISVNGKEQSEVYIRQLARGEDYNDKIMSHSIEIEFEPVIAEADKSKKQLELSLVQISNPYFEVDPIYPSCADLHSNTVISTHILNVNTELKTKEVKKSEISYTEEIITEEVKSRYPKLYDGFYTYNGFIAEIIDENASDLTIEANENGEIKLGAIVAGSGYERLRLLFLVNGIPSKLSDGSDYIEINARTGYLYEIKPDKILDVKLYDTVNVLVTHCPDERENTYFSRAGFPDVVLPYNYYGE